MNISRRTRRASISILTVAVLLGLFAPMPAGAVALGAPNLNAASDSGFSSTDDVTNAAALTFTVDGTAENDILQLVRDTTPVGTRVVAGSGGSVELTDPSPSEGTYNYKAQRLTSDDPPNVIDESAALSVVVDRTAPVGTPGTPDLDPASDSATTTDNVTNNNTPTFSISGSAPAESFIELLRGGATIGSGLVSAPYTEPVSVADGTYQYSARFNDLAGNGGTASANLQVVIDTAAAAPVIDLPTASDLGRSSTDNITTTYIQDSAPALYLTTLSVTLTRETGATLSWTRKVNTGAATAPATIAPASPATITTLTSALATIAPVNGSYLFTATQTDVAGNISPPGTLTVTLDSTPPTAATLDLTDASDTFPAAGASMGLTNQDNITSSVIGVAPNNLVFNVGTEAVASCTTNCTLVEMYRDGQLVGQATADAAGNASVTDAKSWGLNPDAAVGATNPAQPSNMHGYVAQVSDVAGNRNKSGNLPVYVDTENPGAASKLDLVPGSDTGSDDTDDITKDNTPTFLVAGAEDNALVELLRCPGAAACTLTNTGGVVLARRLGNGEITAPTTADNDTVSNTSWRFTVRQTDASGRVSSLFSTNINVVIDTTALHAPSQPRLLSPAEIVAADDAAPGVVAPTFQIDDASGRVRLLRDGVVVATRTAAGRISDPGPLSNGTYTYTAISVDTAGNESAPSLATVVTIANGGGYWLVGSDGGIFAFGDAGFFGSLGDKTLNAPVLGLAATPSRNGYWAYAADGGVFAFGDAGFHGSTGAMVLNKPIVGMVATPAGNGYYLFAVDGGVFTFGDAVFHGTPAAAGTSSPIVAMTLTPDGAGYWLVDATGKIYGYGSAASLTGVSAPLNAPIVGMAATPSGKGLWLVAGDGGVFAIGDALFFGSAGGMRLNQPIVGMVAMAAGDGYYLYASDGGVFAFGKAPHHGSTGGMVLNKPIVGMAAS